jgi:hypothetical protein
VSAFDPRTLLEELAHAPEPPTRLESGPIYAAGRRRRQNTIALRAVTAVAVVAALGFGASLVPAHGTSRPTAPPSATETVPSPAGSPLPVLHDLPAPECRESEVKGATEIARALPIAGGWKIGYTNDCDWMYIKFTNETPYGTVVMELRSEGQWTGPTRCTEKHCRETDIGPLSWDMLPSSLFGDPPGKIASNNGIADLIRKRDRRTFQLNLGTIYPKSGPVLTHPFTPEQLSDAVLAAARVM